MSKDTDVREVKSFAHGICTCGTCVYIIFYNICNYIILIKIIIDKKSLKGYYVILYSL